MSEPNEIYEAVLGQLKSSRSRKSLEALHAVCKEHYESGAVDFRITTIAKVGASRGVPSAQTIRTRLWSIVHRLSFVVHRSSFVVQRSSFIFHRFSFS